MSNYIFTSESVSEGHPDKIADRISDTILDHIIFEAAEQAPSIRCASETLLKNNTLVIAGEIRRAIETDQQQFAETVQELARKAIIDIGYDDISKGFNGNNCEISYYLDAQSQDIASGVDSQNQELGAGDQGLMFGYACAENDNAQNLNFMPTPIALAHDMMRRHKHLRNGGDFPWLRPDAKSQISILYQNNIPTKATSIVLSMQHQENIDMQQLREFAIESIIKPTLEQSNLPDKSLPATQNIHINPTGIFVIGGPAADCGLTGRKIVVDTYGGSCPHGGGAFSGKDPTKVDRSAAYFMRYLAKNIVAAQAASHCTIQVSYAIGYPKPISLMVNVPSNSRLSGEEIKRRIESKFSLTPGQIIEYLQLFNHETVKYSRTTAHGHFGYKPGDFPWENLDILDLFN